MIRIIATILLGLLLEPAVQVTDPTPEDLLEGAIKAIGGEHAIESLESFKLHGMIRLPDGRPVIEVDLATFTGGKVLAVQTFVGIGQTRFGSDGSTSWEENPSSTNTQVYKLIDDKTLSQKVKQLNWIEWLTKLPIQLEKMKVQGETEFDDEACWILHIEGEGKFDSGEQAFFSKATKRLIGRQTIEHTNNGDAIVNIYFRDWRPVGDLQLFHTVVFNRDGIEVAIVFDTIEVDSVDERIFELPNAVIKLRDKK
ncbi:MAG: hypothetical protein HOC93_02145 [Phycisphaerae bacterium]|jgi:hypothetical protein|nr:hypothetical protein [Phycisphaerae bacterium]